ncbi:hypothetical protein CBX57_017285 [Salmonella enterica]|nr:hypothetical protein [Salmonella enterica]
MRISTFPANSGGEGLFRILPGWRAGDRIGGFITVRGTKKSRAINRLLIDKANIL